jgi:hypothetical protein
VATARAVASGEPNRHDRVAFPARRSTPKRQRSLAMNSIIYLVGLVVVVVAVLSFFGLR